MISGVLGHVVNLGQGLKFSVMFLKYIEKW